MCGRMYLTSSPRRLLYTLLILVVFNRADIVSAGRGFTVDKFVSSGPDSSHSWPTRRVDVKSSPQSLGSYLARNTAVWFFSIKQQLAESSDILSQLVTSLGIEQQFDAFQATLQCGNFYGTQDHYSHDREHSPPFNLESVVYVLLASLQTVIDAWEWASHDFGLKSPLHGTQHFPNQAKGAETLPSVNYLSSFSRLRSIPSARKLTADPMLFPRSTEIFSTDSKGTPYVHVTEHSFLQVSKAAC